MKKAGMSYDNDIDILDWDVVQSDDDYINSKFYNSWTVATMLIVYGILFIIIEKLKWLLMLELEQMLL